jgi:hypothetical protein
MVRQYTYLVILLVLSAACGRTSPNPLNQEPRLKLSPDTSLQFPATQLDSSSTQTIRLKNTGLDELKIHRFEIQSTSDHQTQTQFHRSNKWFGATVIDAGEYKDIEVAYSPTEPSDARAQFSLWSNAANLPEGKASVSLEASGEAPRLKAPNQIRFSQVTAGNSDWKMATVRNTGDAPLNIDQIELSGPNQFRVTYPDPNDEGIDKDLNVNPKSVLQPGESLDIRIWFQPNSPSTSEGQLVIRSNAAKNSVHKMRLRGTSNSGCIEVNIGEGYDFGVSPLDRSNRKTIIVENCSGTSALRISKAAITDSDNGAFKIGETNFAQRAKPLNIAPRESVRLVAVFTPDDKRMYRGVLEINNNSENSPDLEIDLTGRGDKNDCPTAVARARIGSTGTFDRRDITAAPLSTIHLNGWLSSAPGGSVKKYEWSLIQKPEDSTAELSPTRSGPTPRLKLDLAGTYTVELKVFDGAGQSSCGDRSTIQIRAIPEDDIHVQLTWRTPKDPDQTNECGADVDLHYRHERGEWRDSKWDVFYQNQNPDWGIQGEPSDDPRLDIDDIDGAGPENIVHNPGNRDQSFEVGVHYYRSELQSVISEQCPDKEPSNYGPSYATVRIYLQGELTFESEDHYLPETDAFWEVTTIDWPPAN